jgi:hypothetical protein
MKAPVRDWDAVNAEYLESATDRVRAGLERLAAETAPATAPTRRGWLVGSRAHPPDAPTAESGEGGAPAADNADAACRGVGPPMPVHLRELFGLCEFELNVLLLCLAVELDTRVRWLCARAQDEPSAAYPTFALAARLFPAADWRVLMPDGPLRQLRLIEVRQPAATPLVAAPLELDERVLHLCKQPAGRRGVDDRVTALIAPVRSNDALPESQEETAREIAGRWQSGDAGGEPPVALLIGADAASKLRVAQLAARLCGSQLCRLPLEQLPIAEADVVLLARLWRRESLLFGLALYVDADDAAGLGVEGPTAGRIVALNRFLGIAGGLAAVAARDPGARFVRPSFAVEVDKPTSGEQQDIWQTELAAAAGPDADVIAGDLAGQFHLDADTIRQVARRTTVTRGRKPLRLALWDECLSAARPRLDGLAQPVRIVCGFDDLVLPDRTIGQLRALADQVRHRRRVYGAWGFGERLNRGLGISALFAGPSGTGKTSAAEAIAGELRLALFRVDLSAVVSKYIGETEKNLRRVFDAFDDGGAVLMIDEADALFGKRTEVKDSHDRYANIEVSYLLQRLEGYRGLAILATNNRGAVDAAFLRRLRFVIEFPQAEVADRLRIWQRMLPPRGPDGEAPAGRPPTDGLDYVHLAAWDLSGGNILTVALNAAFRAAGRGADALAMPDVLAAVEEEMRKLNRAVRPADLYTTRWRPADRLPTPSPISTNGVASRENV